MSRRFACKKCGTSVICPAGAAEAACPTCQQRYKLAPKATDAAQPPAAPLKTAQPLNDAPFEGSTTTAGVPAPPGEFINVQPQEPRRTTGQKKTLPWPLILGVGGAAVGVLLLVLVVVMIGLTGGGETNVAEHTPTGNTPPAPSNLGDRPSLPIRREVNQPPVSPGAESNPLSADGGAQTEETFAGTDATASNSTDSNATENTAPVSSASLADRITLANTYSLQPPADFSQTPSAAFGTPERWLAEFHWQSTTAPAAHFVVAIERHPDYAQARGPRVSNRVVTGATDSDATGADSPVQFENETYILPGAELSERVLAGRNFTLAESHAGSGISSGDALLLCGYDHDRMIRISAWIDGDGVEQAARLEQLKYAALSFQRVQDLANLAAPVQLARDETKLASEFATTSLPAIEPISNPGPDPEEITAAAVSSGGKVVAFGRSDGKIFAHNTATGEEIAKFDLVGDRVGLVKLWRDELVYGFSEALSKALTMRIGAPYAEEFAYATCASVAEDAQRLAMSKWRRIVVGSPDGAQLTASMNAQYVTEVTALQLTDDGAAFAYGSRSGDIRIWSPARKQFFYQAKVHEGGTRQLAFSPDAKTLLSAGGDNELGVWDVASKKPLQRIPDFGEVGALTFLPDGVRAAIFHDGKLEIWRFDEPKIVKTLNLPEKTSLVAFSNDRRFAVAVKSGGWTYNNVTVIELDP